MAEPSSGTRPMRFLVAPEVTYKMTAHRGERLHELQMRSGARIQLSDWDSERLCEVVGSRQQIDLAVQLLVEDFATSKRNPDQISRDHWGPQGEEKESVIAVCALISEALSRWLSGGDRLDSFASAGGLLAARQSGQVTTGERRLELKGAPGPVFSALLQLGLQEQRYEHSVSTGVNDLPWELCDMREEGDPQDDFLSTENLRLVVPDDAVEVLSPGGAHSTTLAQIREESGAAVRLHAGAAGKGEAATVGTSSGTVEIAGCYGTKLRALLQVASLLLQLCGRAAGRAQAGGLSLQMLLPSAGPSAVRPEDVRELASAEGVEVKVREKAGKLLVAISGARSACCAAAIALCRAGERRAADHQRVHGPPPLLVDYLARWFGGSRRGAVLGSSRGRVDLSVLPTAQMGRQQAPQKALGRARPAAAAAQAPATAQTRAAQPAAAAAAAPAPEHPPPPAPAAGCARPPPPERARPHQRGLLTGRLRGLLRGALRRKRPARRLRPARGASGPPPAKRRRAAPLFNPFGDGEAAPPPAGAAALGDSPAAGEVALAPVGVANFLQGYSDGSDEEDEVAVAVVADSDEEAAEEQRDAGAESEDDYDPFDVVPEEPEAAARAPHEAAPEERDLLEERRRALLLRLKQG